MRHSPQTMIGEFNASKIRRHQRRLRKIAGKGKEAKS